MDFQKSNDWITRNDKNIYFTLNRGQSIHIILDKWRISSWWVNIKSCMIWSLAKESAMWVSLTKWKLKKSQANNEMGWPLAILRELFVSKFFNGNQNRILFLPIVTEKLENLGHQILLWNSQGCQISYVYSIYIYI